MRLLRRELGFKAISRSFFGTAETTGMIFLIFMGADMLNSALALAQTPAQLAEWVATLEAPPLAIAAAILGVYIVLGFFMDELSTVILTIPVIFPAVMGLDLWGLDYSDKAIWFGILVLMVVEIGLIAPPVGLNVYVVNGIDKDTPIGESYRGVMPFLATDFVRTTLLLFFPVISLYLTQFMR